MSQRTFSIIKPDAVQKGHAGAILAEIEKAGFKIVSIKKLSISKEQAEGIIVDVFPFMLRHSKHS